MCGEIIIQLVLLAGVIIGYLYRSYKHIQIDPKMPQKGLLPIEVDGEKWIFINPSTKWQLIEALYIYISWELFGKPKQSNLRRIKFFQKLGFFLSSFLIAIGTFTLCVHADVDMAYIKRKLSYQIAEVKQAKLKHEEQNQPEPKPQISMKKSAKELQIIEQDPPKLKPITAKKAKPHKDEVHKLNERIHKINEKLNRIENKLDKIEKTLPTNNIDVKPLNRLNETITEVNRTIKEVNRTIEEVNRTIEEVNRIQQQIPVLNKTIKVVDDTIKEVDNLQKQITGILR